MRSFISAISDRICRHNKKMNGIDIGANLAAAFDRRILFVGDGGCVAAKQRNLIDEIGVAD